MNNQSFIIYEFGNLLRVVDERFDWPICHLNPPKKGTKKEGPAGPPSGRRHRKFLQPDH